MCLAGPGVSHKGTLSKVEKGLGQKPDPSLSGTFRYPTMGTLLSVAWASDDYLRSAHAKPCLGNALP